MPRKGPAPRRDLMPDPVYRSVIVTQVVNKVLLSGKRSVAEKIVYDALDIVKDKSGGDALTVLNEGGIAHNLTVERGPVQVAGTASFLAGDRERLRIDMPPGRYRILCTVPGHERLGMTGTLTVR